MADGYQVDPAILRGASRDVYAGSDSVGDAAALLDAAQLVPAALGEVPAADELARAFATFVGEHGDDLRHGSVWVNDAADGLVSSADDYERRDDTAAGDLTAAGPA
ncbi:type VII secretion target [Actinophytocola sp.]|uniref:type VII secretion target n=1 Tax=Actinophytocola sp. TaxID=1872138 RepID=UPI0025BB2260|nr:type VII secretion target [Actinophytocola sp.]